MPAVGDLKKNYDFIFFCTYADEEESGFETGAMANENLLNARNAYMYEEVVSLINGLTFSIVNL